MTTWYENLIYFVIGVPLWGFIEYLIHRWIFHGELWILPDNSFAFSLHFLIHGIHHAFPMDRYRLVFPPLPGIALWMTVAYFPFTLIFDKSLNAIFAGTMFGYMLFEQVHYWIHHSTSKWGYLKSMKIYHMQHHYKNGKLAFGVTNKFWDYVFCTAL